MRPFFQDDARPVQYDTEFLDSRSPEMKTAGSGFCQPFLFQLWNSGKLAVSATVSAASVETSTAMEPATTTVKTSTAMKATITASETAAVEASAPAEIASAVTPARSPIEATPVIAASIETAAIVTAAVETSPVIAVIPGAGTDKHAVDKVVRAVVAIRRTTIRVIPIVAVSADRSGTVVRWTNSNADKHSLRVRRNCHREHANSQ